MNITEREKLIKQIEQGIATYKAMDSAWLDLCDYGEWISGFQHREEQIEHKRDSVTAYSAFYHSMKMVEQTIKEAVSKLRGGIGIFAISRNYSFEILREADDINKAIVIAETEWNKLSSGEKEGCDRFDLVVSEIDGRGSLDVSRRILLKSFK